MTTLIMFHEVNDAENWVNSWKKCKGIKHELFSKIGVKVRTFQDPNNPNMTGGILDVPDMKAFEELLATEEIQKATVEDGMNMNTLRVLSEFTP